MAACTVCAAASQEGEWSGFSLALSGYAQQGDIFSAFVAIPVGKGLQQGAEKGLQHN
jgi:hypothetical protein